MSYLVDTNVLSETLKPAPAARVAHWLKANESECFVSAVTVGEIRRGVEILPTGRRKEELSSWLEQLCTSLERRVVGLDLEVAHVWGNLCARLERQGLRLSIPDSQIAATALHHGLTVVTRNVRDFERTGVPIFNPFDLSE